MVWNQCNKAMENNSNEVKYKEEHLACEYYISDERAIWKVVELAKDEFVAKEALVRSTLVFIMSGKLKFSTDYTLAQDVMEGNMFLIPAGSNFYGRALDDSVLLCCSFTLDIALCNKFSIRHLQAYLNLETETVLRSVTLPIHPLLFKELEITRDMIVIGLSCIHYQRMKLDTVFIELRGLYCREDLAALFAPLFGSDDDFKNKVLQMYQQVDSVKELVNCLNMSSSCFKRKFNEAFGTTAKQWLIQRKKMKLLRDLVMTNMPIAEVAEKYKFTSNYLAAFCKEHFGKTPTELRADCLKGFNC